MALPCDALFDNRLSSHLATPIACKLDDGRRHLRDTILPNAIASLWTTGPRSRSSVIHVAICDVMRALRGSARELKINRSSVDYGRDGNALSLVSNGTVPALSRASGHWLPLRKHLLENAA